MLECDADIGNVSVCHTLVSKLIKINYCKINNNNNNNNTTTYKAP